uniref:(California timema) hypothetical protein n=1 Tax=Timema californicum TaxID=61474 RepID=A0A7R9PBR4_TIMCA|nr:unnamed protein product [Timema californicum]
MLASLARTGVCRFILSHRPFSVEYEQWFPATRLCWISFHFPPSLLYTFLSCELQVSYTSGSEMYACVWAPPPESSEAIPVLDHLSGRCSALATSFPPPDPVAGPGKTISVMTAIWGQVKCAVPTTTNHMASANSATTRTRRQGIALAAHQPPSRNTPAGN